MILVPADCWQTLLHAFSTAPPGCERVGYLDGVRVGEVAIVSTVVLPDAELHPRFYHVTAAAMSEAGAHLRRYGLLRLAQVHTHGGAWVGHSEDDDQRAYSQRPGAVSIVLPHHGFGDPEPGEGGAHVRHPEGWRQLSAPEATEMLRLVPSVLDFRTTR